MLKIRLLMPVLLVALIAPLTGQADVSGEGDSGAWAADGGRPDQVERAGDQDPWEGFNRRVFAFNERLDAYVLKPVAQGYRRVTPGWFRQTTGRFFANLNDARSGVHSLLQWEWRQAGHNLGRFSLNSTLGIGGLFDVASSSGLDRYPEDLGLTLGRWGVPEGPYLVIPVLGPSTVRDGLAFYPDTFLSPGRYLIEDHKLRYSLTGLYVINVRESLLDMEAAIRGDRYLFMRDYYLGNRRQASGRWEDAGFDDDFGDMDDDWDDDEW